VIDCGSTDFHRTENYVPAGFRRRKVRYQMVFQRTPMPALFSSFICGFRI